MDLAENVFLEAEPDESFWLDLLRDARPQGFKYTYILADVSVDFVATSNQVATLADQLHPLLRLITPLARMGVYLKLFLLAEMEQYLSPPPDTTVEKIQWTKKSLEELLEVRLGMVGLEDLGQLFDLKAEYLNPTDLLIEAAEGSPRRLIHFGNQLLKEQVKLNPDKEKIDPALLYAILELR